MSKVARLASLSLAFICPALAHADTYQDYAFYASISNGTTASGYVFFDETTGLFVGGSISGSYGLFNDFRGSRATDSTTYLNLDNAAGELFQVQIPGNKDVSYAGGSICSTTYTTGCVSTLYGGPYESAMEGPAYITFPVISGSLTATPEPSSFVLLSTGLLGLAGAARRRFLSA